MTVKECLEEHVATMNKAGLHEADLCYLGLAAHNVLQEIGDYQVVKIETLKGRGGKPYTIITTEKGIARWFPLRGPSLYWEVGNG